jgi:hypothetical protein
MIYTDPSSLFFVEQNGTYVMLDCVFGVRRGDYTPGYTVSVVPMAPGDPYDEAERLALLAVSYDHLH